MSTGDVKVHLSHEEIQDFISGGLEATAQTQVTGHLQLCRMCNSTYRALVEVDRALRLLPMERVDTSFTREVMNKIPLISKAPLAFRALEKLAPLFALFVVVVVLLVVFVITGVIDVQQVSEGQSKVQEYLSGSATIADTALGSFSAWLAEYVPFVFGTGSLGITGSIFAVVFTLALLDRVLSRKLVQRTR